MLQVSVSFSLSLCLSVSLSLCLSVSLSLSLCLSVSLSLPGPSLAHGNVRTTCSRPIPTLLLDAAAQTPPHSAASADATTQLPLTEFFLGCIHSKDPLDHSVPPPAHGPAHSASLPQPSDIATINSLSSTSNSSGPHACTQVSRARLHSARPQPPGLQGQAPLISHHGIPVKAAPVPSLQPHVSTTQVGTHTDRSSASYKRSASTALARTHHAIGADPRAGRGPFPKPRALVLSMVKFGQAKPDGLGHIDTADGDIMHHQYRLSVLQWNRGPARRNPTNIIAATCGRSHAVKLQEASDHVPHITDQFLRTLATRTSPSCSTRIPLSQILRFTPSKEASTSKDTWAWFYSSFEAFCVAPLSGTPTVTFCSVHINNVVAKKRDASNNHPRRLHGYMQQYNVDFIGTDFNMSAFSTVGDVFSETEFSAPGNSFLWGLGALEEPNCGRTGFLIMPKRPCEWRVDTHGYNKLR